MPDAPLPTCDEACAAFAACPDPMPTECASRCGSTVGDLEDRTCLAAAVTCPAAMQCVGLAQPFASGPYGFMPRDLAGPVTLPTLDGDFSFEGTWTGLDSYLFLLHHGGNAYSDALWASDLGWLLVYSPLNVHYFFLAVTDTDGVDRVAEHVADLRVRVEQAIAAAEPATQASWRAHLHVVTQNALELDGWVGDLARARSIFAFGIDRLQRIREVGMLLDPAASSAAQAELYFFAYEAQHFEFEWQRELALRDEEATEIQVFDSTPVGVDGNDIYADLVLPDGPGGFDTMLFDLSMSCTDHVESNCPAWDQLAQLFLCDEADPSQCTTEIGRWVTTYGREGRWVTDASPWLALLASGGTRRVRFNAIQPYVIDLTVRLSRRAEAGAPAEAFSLWTGGAFDATYNDRHQPITFEVPDGTLRVDLAVLLSGHGWGVEAANCAEFCNHTHHFSVNGTEYVKAHPEAGSRFGCRDRIDEGVVPNQFGTWPYGRGGWCPGLDVAPWVVDVTDALVSGENTISYQALVNGQPYVPQPSPDPNPTGFAAVINMESALVFWR